MTDNCSLKTTPLQPPIKPPSTTVGDVKIYARRSGDHVIGRVVFPQPTRGPAECPIDYRSTRPVSSASEPIVIKDEKQHCRVLMVEAYTRLCRERPHRTKRQVAEDTIRMYGRGIKRCSVRTLQTWIKTFEIEGPEGLRDNYVPRPRRVASFTSEHASDAIKICAWWAWRIGNAKAIDTKMMTAAVTLPRASHQLADVIAVIDHYYKAISDPKKFPYKPFERWARYDFDKWLFRACDENDRLRSVYAARNAKRSVPLDQKSRRQDVNCRHNREQVRSMAGLTGPDQADPKATANADAPTDSRLSPNEAIAAGRVLGSIGCKEAAAKTVASAAPGVTPLCNTVDHATIDEAIGALDDSYRTMLISAAAGDRDARQQAAATLPMWWDKMPSSARRSIDQKVNAWLAEHRYPADHPGAANRRLMMLLATRRTERRGVKRLGSVLGVAARIPR